MDCNKAGDYMMRYMDGSLDDTEAALLHQHIIGCAECQEDFMLYDCMMENFSSIPLTEAPDGFVQNVMSRVRLLPSPVGVINSRERIMYGVWGVFSVLVAFGYLLGKSKEVVLKWLAAHETFYPLAVVITTVSDTIAYISNALSAEFQRMTLLAGNVFGNMQFVLLAIAVLLAVVQIYLYRKDKVEV